jgi:hypothetical protein
MVSQYIKNELSDKKEIFTFYNDSIESFFNENVIYHIVKTYKLNLSDIAVLFKFIIHTRLFIKSKQPNIYKQKLQGLFDPKLKTLKLQHTIETCNYEAIIISENIPSKLVNEKYNKYFKTAINEDIEKAILYLYTKNTNDYSLYELSKEKQNEKLLSLKTEYKNKAHLPFDFLNLYHYIDFCFKKNKIFGRINPITKENNIVNGAYYQFISQYSLFGFFKRIHYHQIILRYVSK